MEAKKASFWRKMIYLRVLFSKMLTLACIEAVRKEDGTCSVEDYTEYFHSLMQRAKEG